MLIPPKKTLSPADFLDRTVWKMAGLGIPFALAMGLVLVAPLWVNSVAGFIAGGLIGRLLVSCLPEEM